MEARPDAQFCIFPRILPFYDKRKIGATFIIFIHGQVRYIVLQSRLAEGCSFFTFLGDGFPESRRENPEFLAILGNRSTRHLHPLPFKRFGYRLVG